MRLGVLTRLGIVLTAFWMVGGTLYFVNKQIGEREGRISAGYSLCLAFNRELPREKHTDCWDEMKESRARSRLDLSDVWLMNLGMAATIAVLAWILGLIIYWSARWVLAGRSLLSKPRP